MAEVFSGTNFVVVILIENVTNSKTITIKIIRLWKEKSLSKKDFLVL